MPAMTSPRRRDDFGWATPAPASIGLSRGRTEESSAPAGIIPFHTVPSPPRHPAGRRSSGEWRTARDHENSLPRIVPVSLIRQIDRELRMNDCDPTILADDCRGVNRASSLFEEIYITARVHAYTRESASRVDPLPFSPPFFVTVMPASQSDAHRHSTAILHGGHLMQHFGIWIVALLTLQLLSAWTIGSLAEQTVGGARYLHSATWLFLMLAFNLRVWFLYYGREAKAFHTPGICLFLTAILPVFLLRLLALY